MNGIVRRLPVWLTGMAVASAGLVVGTSGAPAFACGEQGMVASGGGGMQLSRVAGVSPVQVSGGGSINVPAGGAAPFSVTVDNAGGGFGGSIDLEVRTSGPSMFPAMTMELQGDAGNVVTWKRLAEEGTPGARWFTADGLSFQSGERSEGFRLGSGRRRWGAGCGSPRTSVTPPDGSGARRRSTSR